MNPRENLLSLLKKQGFSYVPPEFKLSPHLIEVFREKTGQEDFFSYFQMPWRRVCDLRLDRPADAAYLPYYADGLKPGATINWIGVAKEPGSAAAMHMTHMRSPLRDTDSLEAIASYPMPRVAAGQADFLRKQVSDMHAQGLAAFGNMQLSIWETAWSIRGMEPLMMDMAADDEKAEVLLDAVTDVIIEKSLAYAAADVDILFIGDDVGMQRSLMMSETMYVDWLKPRHKRLIETVKARYPNILVFYHSCGYITPLIPHLIDAGIDVLNPVQPECMDFADIWRDFSDKISFHGTIGTQSVMPFGTPDEVRRAVFRHLDIAGPQGGLFVAPTHLLEPEVPWENILAYVEACRDYVK